VASGFRQQAPASVTPAKRLNFIRATSQQRAGTSNGSGFFRLLPFRGFFAMDAFVERHVGWRMWISRNWLSPIELPHESKIN
jgi:hypothetical protein